jgi:rhodanese-related sulfurtransferase
MGRKFRSFRRSPAGYADTCPATWRAGQEKRIRTFPARRRSSLSPQGAPAAVVTDRTVCSQTVSFIRPEELDHLLRTDGARLTVVDVREPVEHQDCRIEGSILIPLSELPWRATELDPSRTIVLYCRSGVRSIRAAECLTRLGFCTVKCLSGGIEAWTKRGDRSLPCYGSPTKAGSPSGRAPIRRRGHRRDGLTTACSAR